MKKVWLKWLRIGSVVVGLLILLALVYYSCFTLNGQLIFRYCLPKYVRSYVAYCEDDKEIERTLSHRPAVVPFSVDPNGLIIVNIKLRNGREAKVLPFILDSGASILNIVHSISASFPRLSRYFKHEGPAGKANVCLVQVPEVDFGGNLLHDNLATAAALPTCTDAPFFGMIGNSVLDHFVVTINNESSTLTLYAPNHFKVSTSAYVIKSDNMALPWMPVFTSQALFVRCNVGGQSAVLLVDTGAPTSRIQEKFLKAKSLKKHLLTVGTVRIPNMSFRKIDRKGLPQGVDGFLGEDFLRLFKCVSIDIRSSKLMLEPYSGGRLDESECWLTSSFSCGNRKEALEYLDKLIKEGHPDYRAYLYRGRFDQDENKAIEDFSRSIALCDKFATPFIYRGKCYAKKADYSKAIKDLTTAIDIFTAEPDSKRTEYGWDGEPYVWRGWVYECISKPLRALTDYSEAIAINPKSSYAYEARARVYDELGLHDQAKKDRKMVSELER